MSKLFAKSPSDIFPEEGFFCISLRYPSRLALALGLVWSVFCLSFILLLPSFPLHGGVALPGTGSSIASNNDKGGKCTVFKEQSSKERPTHPSPMVQMSHKGQ